MLLLKIVTGGESIAILILPRLFYRFLHPLVFTPPLKFSHDIDIHNTQVIRDTISRWAEILVKPGKNLNQPSNNLESMRCFLCGRQTEILRQKLTEIF